MTKTNNNGQPEVQLELWYKLMPRTSTALLEFRDENALVPRFVTRGFLDCVVDELFAGAGEEDLEYTPERDPNEKRTTKIDKLAIQYVGADPTNYMNSVSIEKVDFPGAANSSFYQLYLTGTEIAIQEALIRLREKALAGGIVLRGELYDGRPPPENGGNLLTEKTDYRKDLTFKELATK